MKNTFSTTIVVLRCAAHLYFWIQHPGHNDPKSCDLPAVTLYYTTKSTPPHLFNFPLSLSQLQDLITVSSLSPTMTDTHVPSVSNFPDIYPAEALDAQSKRWNNLLSTFESRYNAKADFVSRSPGRVNIIGEVRVLILLGWPGKAVDAMLACISGARYCMYDPATLPELHPSLTCPGRPHCRPHCR